MFAKDSRNVFVLAVSLALLAALCSSASATSIYIADAGFETGGTGDPSPPWVVEHAWVYVDTMDHAGSSNGSDHLLWMNAPSGNPANGQGKVSQTLLENYAAGTYTLSTDVAAFYGVAGVTMELRDASNGNAVLASKDYSSSSDTTWNNTQLFFTVQSTDSFVGHAIDIAFTHTGAQSFALDNVALNYAPIPEPGSLMLLMAGLAGLLCYAWRRRK